MSDASERSPDDPILEGADTAFPVAGLSDQVFYLEGAAVIRTPIRAPQANAFAQRWVRSVRQECLGRTLVSCRRQLEKALREYVDHDNAKRPHRGLILRVPRNEGAEPVVFASTAQLRYGTGQGVLSAAVCKRGPLPSAMSASRRDRRMCQAKQRRQAGQPGAGIGTAAVVPQGSIDSCR